jgi:hypothetical protein
MVLPYLAAVRHSRSENQRVRRFAEKFLSEVAPRIRDFSSQ